MNKSCTTEYCSLSRSSHSPKPSNGNCQQLILGQTAVVLVQSRQCTRSVPGIAQESIFPTLRYKLDKSALTSSTQWPSLDDHRFPTQILSLPEEIRPRNKGIKPHANSHPESQMVTCQISTSPLWKAFTRCKKHFKRESVSHCHLKGHGRGKLLRPDPLNALLSPLELS